MSSEAPNERDGHDGRGGLRARLGAGSLAHIELAQANPAWSTVKAIAHALDLSMVQLAEAVAAESG
jgi:hypothetical protein